MYGIGTNPGEVNVLLICVTITIEDKGTNSIRVIDLLRNEDEVFNKMGIKKPENLSIVVSSPLLNQPMELDREKYWMVDHMFTVYEKDFIANNDVIINCGARSCLGCRKCYMDNDTFYINEQLK